MKKTAHILSIKIIKISILSLQLLWLFSCSAPHDNPLDPASVNYKEPDLPPTETPTPTFSTNLRSVHTGRPTTDLYKVLAELWPDSVMGIDSVRIQYSNRNPIRMSFTSQGRWAVSLTSSYFGDDQLESVVGEPFMFYVSASNDSIWNVGPEYLFRVLQETPLTGSPDSNQVTGPFPILSWPIFQPLYPFSYQTIVEQVLDFGIIVTAWTSDTLASNLSQVQVTDSLVDGEEYHWILVVYDNFGNASLSHEANFQVLSGSSE